MTVSPRFYQVVILVLLGSVALLAWPDPNPPVPEPVAVQAAPGSDPKPAAPFLPRLTAAHLPGMSAQMAREQPGATDLSATLYASDIASAHVHFIGDRQICPLHIHRKTEEATVVVTGVPEVELVHGAVVERRPMPPGTLIATGPSCAHKWKNLGGAFQANLVLAHPVFDGNLYVDEDDSRLATAPAPLVVRPQDGLAAFVAGTETVARSEIPVLGGRLSSWFLRGETTLPVRPEVDTLLYVLDGRGEVSQDHAETVEAGSAVVFHRRAPVRVVAREPMAFLLFEPPTAIGAGTP